MKTRFWRANWLRVTIGTSISVASLILALRDVQLGYVMQALAWTNYVWVLLAMFLMVLQSWLRTVRWVQLFYPLSEGLHIQRMFRIVIIAQMLNIVAPFRFGDLVRIYLVGEFEKRSRAQTLGTVGTEKIFDTLILFVMVLATPMFVALPAESESPRLAFIGISVVLFVTTIALLLGGNWLLELLKNLSFPGIRHVLDIHGELALSTLEVFKRLDLHIKLLLLSLVLSVLGVVVNYFTLLALNLPISPMAAVLVFLVLQVGGVIPSSPGKIGIFQYVCILTLSLFAVDQSMGFAYGILLYFIAYGTPIALGTSILLWDSVSLRGLSQMPEEDFD